MGLFSFFSRRTSNKPKAKVQEWDPTLPGSHNQGGYAVADDDQITKETFYGGRTKFTESQPSLDTATEDEFPVAAPRIPHFQDETVERPSTAPNERSSSVTIPTGGPRVKRNGQKRPPPLSYRVPRPETTSPASRPSSRGSITTITNAFRRVSGHSRTSSLRSDGSKAFRDILDAHSEIKPADFRARVQATGARDYGEDVAERNMKKNRFDLRSEHVQGFPDGNGAVYEHIGPKLDRHKAGVRRRSLLSSQLALQSHLSPGSPISSIPEPTRKRDAGRRRSVISYVPPGFDIKAPPRSSERDIEKLKFGFSALKVATPTMPEVPQSAPAPTIRATRLPRDSVELAKRRAEMALPEDLVADGSPPSNFDLWSATRSRRSSTILSAASNTRNHRSLYTLRSSISSSCVSRETVIHATQLSYPPKTPAQKQAQDAECAAHEASMPCEDNDALASPGLASTPSLKSRSSISRIREEEALSGTFPLLATTGAAPGLTTLPDDLEYPPPIRTRSVRAWSASSGTPTAAGSTTAGSMTTSSSRYFNRPPSLHTADTSIDMSIGTVSPELKPSVYSTRSDSITAYHLDGDDGSIRPGTADTTFNIDSYMSTDSFSDADNHHHHHHYHVPPEYPHDNNGADDNSGHNNPEPTHHLHPSEPFPFPSPTTPNLLLQPPETPTAPPPTHLDLPPTHTQNNNTNNTSFNIDDYLSSDASSLITNTNPNPNTYSPAKDPRRHRPTGEGEEELLMSEAWFGSGGVGLPGLKDDDDDDDASGLGVSATSGGGGGGVSRAEAGVGFGGGFASFPLAAAAGFPAAAGMGGGRVGGGGGVWDGRGVHTRRRSDGKRVWAAAEDAGRGGGKRLMVMDLPLPLSLHSHSVAGSRAAGMPLRGLGLGEFGVEVGGWGEDFGRVATGTGTGTGRRRRSANRARERIGARRFVLDTAADDETTSESGGEWQELERRAGLALNGNDDHDDGYEADYIEDESEGLPRRRRRKKRTRRLSALCQPEDQETENSQRSPQQDETQSETFDERVDDKVTAAVRLRKKVMRARRLAGQPSAAMLRRKPPVNQWTGPGLPVPVPMLRVEEAE